MICLAWSPYERAIRSFALVLRHIYWPPLKPTFLPGRLGTLGLIVATSKAGLALASIGGILGDGGGMVHSVSGVARVKIRGSELDPWVQVPLKVFPSGLSLPVYMPKGRVIFRVVPSTMRLLAM